METIKIGSHEIQIKSQIIKKDIVPLSKLQKIYDSANKEGQEIDAETMVTMNDLLIEIMVVDIDGATDRKEIKAIVEQMSVSEYTDLSRVISEFMQKFEKKSEISSMSTSAS